MIAFYLFSYFSFSQYFSDTISESSRSLSNNKIHFTPSTIRVQRFSDIYSPVDVSFSTDGVSHTPITKIPDNLFRRCQIGTLTISKYITTIGIQSFYCCSINEIIFEKESKLETISNYAFYSVSFNKSFSFPDQIKNIGESSFEKSGIQTINFNNIMYIGKNSFRGCTKLSSSLKFNYKQLTIGRSAFEGCIGLMNSVITFNNNGNEKVSCDCLGSLIIEEDAFKDIVFSRVEIDRKNQSENMMSDCVEYISRFVRTSSNTDLVTRTLESDFGQLGPNVYYNFTGEILDIYGDGPMYDNYTYGESPLHGLKFEMAIIEDSVTSIGVCMFSDCTSLVNITLPESLNSIGIKAFEQCTSLVSITLPNSLTSVGEAVFQNCDSLESVTFPDNLTSIEKDAFKFCRSLASITFPDSLTSIGDSAFSSCSFESITFPNSLTSIGRFSFYFCRSLTSIVLPDRLTSISDYAFDSCPLKSITVPKNLTSIGESAFSSCSLENITLPNSLTLIGASAFKYCLSLKNITLPNSLTSIYSSAFEHCTSLVSIILPNNLTYVSKSLFKDCTSLERIVLPNNLTSIYESGFHGCSSLASISLPNSLTSIGNYAFNGCSSLEDITLPNGLTSTGYGTFYSCTSLKKINIPENLTSIEESVFSHCISLTSIILSKRITIIGRDAFYECISLQSIELPIGLKQISAYSFGNCIRLSSINLHNSVKSIGVYAFWSCICLTTVLNTENVTSIGSGSFLNCSSLKSINFGYGITTIGEETFSDCKSLETFNIPGSVTKIRELAFKSCTSLSSVSIPNNVTLIENGAFMSCTSLSSVTYFGSFMPSCTNLTFVGCEKLSSINVFANYANESFCGIDNLIVNDMPCLVDGCIKCVNGTNDQCEECNPSYIKVDGKCIDLPPTETSTVSQATTLPDPTETSTVSQATTLPDPTETSTASQVTTLPDPTELPTASQATSLPDPTELPTASQATSLPDPTELPTASQVTSLPDPTELPTASPTPAPDVEPDYGQVDEDGNLDFNFDSVNSTGEVTLKLDYSHNSQSGHIIKSVVIRNANSKRIAIEISGGYTELSFRVDEATSNKAFDLVTLSSSSSITIGLSPSTFASIRNGQGRLTLHSTANSDTSLKLNKVQPSSSSLTVVPRDKLSIEELDFSEAKSALFVDSKDETKVSLASVKLEQGCFGIVGNATITGVVTVGVSSTLEINDKVDLQSSTVKYDYSNPELALSAGIIRGKIASVPSKVVVSINTVGTSNEEEKKTLLAESSDVFDCDSWGGNIEYHGVFSSYACESGESGSHALYATTTKRKKSKKLPAGAIAGIAVTAVVVVGVIAFVLVYFLVIKKQKDVRSTTSESLISEKKESLLF